MHNSQQGIMEGRARQQNEHSHSAFYIQTNPLNTCNKLNRQGDNLLLSLLLSLQIGMNAVAKEKSRTLNITWKHSVMEDSITPFFVLFPSFLFVGVFFFAVLFSSPLKQDKGTDP